MDKARLREMASRGGKSVKPEQRSFSKDASLAAAAGRKGGLARSRRNAPGALGLSGDAALSSDEPEKVSRTGE